MMAGSVTSAPPGNALPDKALANYDIRSDNGKEDAQAFAGYREKANANTEALAATRELLATGRSNLFSRIPGLHALIFGDVTGLFADRPGGPSQDAADKSLNISAPAPITMLSLPNFTADVRVYNKVH